MASDSGPYLPDLGRCFSGDTLLLSWDDILKSLLSHDTKQPTSRAAFFSDQPVKTLLAKPIPSFPPPSAQSKSAFDTKTAPINIPPSQSNQYDIDKIKSDALWLSKQMQVDELEALRLTILEWQYQPEARLQAGFSDAELASLRDALGSEYVESGGLVLGGLLSRSDTTFDSRDGRHVRLLQLYFSEQVRLLSTASEILQQSMLSSSQSKTNRNDFWNSILKVLPAEPPTPLLEVVRAGVDSIKQRLENVNRDPSWPVNEKFQAVLNDDYVTSNLQAIAVVLDMLLLRIKHSEDTVTSESLLTWLQFMDSVDHFSPFQSDVPAQRKAIERIQCTASCITVALLDPSSTFASLVQDTTLDPISLPPSDKRDWYIDRDRISDIQYFLLAAAESYNVNASAAVLAWSLILLEIRTLASTAKETREARLVQKGLDKSPAYDAPGRRLSSSSTGSMQSTIYEDVMNEIMTTSTVEDPVDYLLNAATQGASVFDQFARVCSLAKDDASVLSSVQLQLLQEWVRAVRPSLGYAPELVSAQLALLEPPSTLPTTSPAFNPILNFVGDHFLLQEFFDVGALRFPYESLPFLRMCKALAKGPICDEDGTHYITFRLHQLSAFTQAAVGGFASFNTYREDENANLVTLDYAVGVLDFEPNRFLTTESSEHLDLIPAQTIGEVIKESTPPVIRWQYEYSGLSLLGKWLELHLNGTLRSALSYFEPPQDVAAEIMGLLSALLNTTYSHAKTALDEKAAQQLCMTILDEVGAGLHPDNNIIGLIFDLMEQQLQSMSRASPVGSGYEALIACIDFFSAYCSVQPLQAWSALIRSSSFGAKGTRRSLPSLIAAVEVPSHDFKLLESCARLYETCVDLMLVVSFRNEDQTQSLSDLKHGRPTASQRFNGAALLAYSETMYGAFESMTSWTFGSTQQKERITSHLTSAFFKLLHYTFGLGDELGSTTSLSAALLPAATFIVQMLQQTDTTSSGTGPLMPLLVSAVVERDLKDVFAVPSALQIRPVLSLANILVRYSLISSKPGLGINNSLFNLVPIIVRIPFRDASLWTQCHGLFSSLLEGPTPSLLGHLGSTSCVSFLYCMKHASQATMDPQLDFQMWNLLSRLVTVDQQWFAIVLITGSPPGREQDNGQAVKIQTRGKPILEVALDLLTDINHLDPRVPAGLLNFVGEAQQSWVSVTDSIASRTEFFPHLIRWASSKDSYSTSGLHQALHNKVAAGVTDLAVIHLRRLMALRDQRVFTSFIPLLTWLAANAVEVATYNASLHTNLKKNFAMKYRGLDIAAIKRSGLLETSYGDDYYYDIKFADKVLSDDLFWKNNKGHQSFSAEFQRANLNFSVVDSELMLLRSLERMCVEHGKFFSRSRDVARIMAQIARHCLVANTRVNPPEALFDSLFQTRADLAVVLVRPLAAAGYRGSDYSVLLTAAWDAARFRNGSYEMAITNDDLTYWRSILSVLLMSMQFRVERKLKQAHVADNKALEQIDPYNALFCEVAMKVVGEGLRSVVMTLQEHKQGESTSKLPPPALVGAKDVALLLNILQTILRLPSLPQFAVQLSDALISTGAGRSSLLLYSWSHMLLEAGEPIYADLAARFLASISSLPRVAEEMAVEGVLNRILTARITQTVQNIPNGISHLDKRPNGALFYSIWSQGMLQLCLNLLHAIGGTIAGEISSFLNQFPNQLNRASLALSANPAHTSEGSGTLTTLVASELATLSLISFILASFHDAGASAGVDPAMIIPLAGFDEHKKALAEDIRDALSQEYTARKRRTVAANEREVGMQRNTVRGREGKETVEDLLDKKILRDLRGALRCLSVDEDEDGDGDGDRGKAS